MKHPRLIALLKLVDDSGLIIQREHHQFSKTQIRILDAAHDWDVLLDEWFVTGDTEKQCQKIESIIKQYQYWS